jgi:hypothetical protein
MPTTEEKISPLYPEISPAHIRDMAYRSCNLWLDGLLWQEELPRRDPPQRGAEAVQILGPTLRPMQRIAFMEGWNWALREWEARQMPFRRRVVEEFQEPALGWFKAGCWALGLVLCLLFWWLLLRWL